MEHPENVSEIDRNWYLGKITGFTTFSPKSWHFTPIYLVSTAPDRDQPRLRNSFSTENLKMNELSLEFDQNANRI